MNQREQAINQIQHDSNHNLLIYSRRVKKDSSVYIVVI